MHALLSKLPGWRLASVAVLSFAASAALTSVVVAGIASGQGFVFNGGNENEQREGSPGDDQLHGGAGRDFLNGREGDDVVTGGEDEDTLIGDNAGDGAGEDELAGDEGGDEISGGGGDDVIEGGDGNDFLGEISFVRGGAGTPGEGGNDFIYGDAGNDIVDGGAGSDEIFGGPGHDSLHGGTSADHFEGGPGDDLMNGGDNVGGVDDVSYADSATGIEAYLEPVSAPGGPEITPYATGEGQDELLFIEDLTGSGFDDVLVGSSVANALSGGAGVDHMDALGGTDRVSGGAGADVLVDSEASGSFDDFSGGSDNDEIRGRNATPTADWVECDTGDDDLAIVDTADEVQDDCETAIWPGSARTLTLQVTGPGSIAGPTSAWDGPVVSCAGSCIPAFGDGTRIVLRAVPTGNASFVNWDTGPCVGQTVPICHVSLDTTGVTSSAVFRAAPVQAQPQPLPQPKPKKKKKKKKKKGKK